MTLQNTNDDDLANDVDTDGLVLIKLTAEWCAPCRQYDPVLDQFSDEQNVPTYNLDIDANPKTPLDNQVMGIPTTLVYFNGELVKQFTGAKPYAGLKKEVAPWLDVAPTSV